MKPKAELRQCRITGCKQYGRWSLYHTLPNRKKEWIDVCDKHEKEIGAENLKMRGGYLTTKWKFQIPN